MAKKELKTSDLYRTCSLKGLNFETTKELGDNSDVIGQQKAIDAIQFAMNMPNDGYNVFCLGREGIGKKSLALQLLTKEAQKRKTPDDWCYANNFDFQHKPKALRLPSGKGKIFAKEIEKLIIDIQISLPAVFEGDEYKVQLAEINEAFKADKEKYFADLQNVAKGKEHVAILRMPTGLVVAPTKNGEVLTPETFDKLPKAMRKKILEQMNETQEKLEVAIKEIPKWEKQVKEQINTLHELLTHESVHQSTNELMKKYADTPDVKEYLNDIRKDIVENVALFLDTQPSDDEQPSGDTMTAFVKKARKNTHLINRYKVNVLVHHSSGRSMGAPVIYLDHPNLPNLLGRMERKQQFGALITDFSLIKPGALHLANGGFLIIDARNLLTHPAAWESLKRCLKAKRINIESAEEESGVMSTTTLEPEPIPLNIKIVLIGENDLYYMLSEHDLDFPTLFKVEANFYPRIDRTNDNISKYVELIGTLGRKYKLRPLAKDGVERLIEHASRISNDVSKLTTRMSMISDLMKESDYYAREEKSTTIKRKHIESALFQKINRSNNLHQRFLEQVKNGTILLNVDGSSAGQLNILAVHEHGHITFGQPSRLTCRACIGHGDVVDIEREVEFGGPLHTKGVLILSSYLSSKFAKDEPLSLDATLVVEQSYGPIDGDSASSAELYALLSSVSEVPLNQGIAVTGSVNQLGQIQAIGAVNEKIEGFFDVCSAMGLTGKQGVMIPSANVRNLMLRKDVIEAVSKKKFHIYAVDTIDDGLEILTGMKAGTPDAKGKYPSDTVNGKVAAKLHEFFTKSQKFNEDRRDKRLKTRL